MLRGFVLERKEPMYLEEKASQSNRSATDRYHGVHDYLLESPGEPQEGPEIVGKSV